MRRASSVLLSSLSHSYRASSSISILLVHTHVSLHVRARASTLIRPPRNNNHTPRVMFSTRSSSMRKQDETSSSSSSSSSSSASHLYGTVKYYQRHVLIATSAPADTWPPNFD